MEKTYTYYGPLSAATLPADEAHPNGRHVQFARGLRVTLPDDNDYVKSLVARKYLVPVADPETATAATPATETKPAATVTPATATTAPSGASAASETTKAATSATIPEAEAKAATAASPTATTTTTGATTAAGTSTGV